MAAPADESENGSPINAAEIAERFARLAFHRSRAGAGKNDAPASGDETVGVAFALDGGVSFHRRRSSYLRNSHTSLKVFALLQCDRTAFPSTMSCFIGFYGVHGTKFAKK